MNEPVVGHDGQPVNSEVSPTQDSVAAGLMLRQARESAGVHIAALAVALKVPVHKLEALEAGYFEVFPDVVFVRALASSMCRTLKVDPAPVLALLPRNQPPALSAHRGINASFKPGSGQLASSSSGSGSRTAIFAVIVLLVGAAAVLLWPHRPDGVAGNEPVAATGTVPEAEGTRGADAASPAQPVTALSVPAPSASAPSSMASPSGVSPAATAAVAAPEAPASAPAGSPDAALVIRTRGESWVQVRSAAGATVLQRVLAAGESVTVPGTPPWSVVIGKADVTEVVVHGKPLELKAVSRENVARFEVKP
ncbi:helix-turn-helix domain-containing protein [Acidovorax sp. SUPP2522]|uniref:helix-turn-helix domain-containing protein n=1 Tax=unclassified Acidovorax TaxID=2684926 RepID=UPI0023497C25|nr:MULTISPECIES: helix-turn-helix domain-containing protein [unclassified Acidovorax]WCM99230.1 helix-turn-helix domain-containing protein [Acidovorax sp. GBBC 1281]GKT15966.1 helix-turn-helix domain-containing protein [Acidovorax sp. SUPP2522]